MKLKDYISQERGRASRIASSIGVSPVTVHQWAGVNPKNSKPVPTAHCPAIERATKGAVTCEKLRPDLTWVRIKDKAWPHPQGRPLVDHSQKEAA